MKIVFEKDEVISVTWNEDYFGNKHVEVAIKISCDKNLFKKSSRDIYNLDINYSEHHSLIGEFIWSHNVEGVFYFVSSGPLTTVCNSIDDKSKNNKASKRLAKIQKQLDRLKVELGKD